MGVVQGLKGHDHAIRMSARRTVTGSKPINLKGGAIVRLSRFCQALADAKGEGDVGDGYLKKTCTICVFHTNKCYFGYGGY